MSNKPSARNRLILSPVRLALCALLACSTVLALSGRAHPQPTTSELVARIQEQYERTRSLRADFVQETRSQVAQLGTSARGTLYIQRPRAMRWEYREPKQWFLVVDDKTWHYSPEDMTIYEQTIRLPEVFNLFSGLDKINDTFYITRLPAADTPPPRHRLELLPRNPDFPVSRVELWIDPTSYLVVRIQTEDPLGNLNQVSLYNIQLDSNLDPSLFQLEIPEGVRLERLEAPSP